MNQKKKKEKNFINISLKTKSIYRIQFPKHLKKKRRYLHNFPYGRLITSTDREDKTL